MLSAVPVLAGGGVPEANCAKRQSLQRWGSQPEGAARGDLWGRGVHCLGTEPAPAPALPVDGMVLQYKGYVDRGARLEARYSKRR